MFRTLILRNLSRLYVIRAVTLAALLLAMVLYLPTQVHETYRLIPLPHIQEGASIAPPTFLGFTLVLISTLFFYLLSLSVQDKYQLAFQTNNNDSKFRRAGQVLSALVGILPLAAFILGIRFVANADTSDERLIAAFSKPLSELIITFDQTVAMPQFMLDNHEPLHIATKGVFEAGQYLLNALPHFIGLAIALFVMMCLSAPLTPRVSQSLLCPAALAIAAGLTTLLIMFFWLPGLVDANAGPIKETALLNDLSKWSIRIARGIGLVGVACIFFMLLAYFLTYFFYIYDKIGIPVVSLSFVWIVSLSYFDLNDNHIIRKIDGSVKEFATTPPSANPKTESTYAAKSSTSDVSELGWMFDSWLKSRPSYLRRFESVSRNGEVTEVRKPFPVFIVTAQGGGIYAANLTAIALSRLYYRCPALAHHVFAVSAVSGGALGAAAFAASQRFYADRELVETGKILSENVIEGVNKECSLEEIKDDHGRKVEILSRSFLREDFISPIAAAGLFPDFAQRFWPKAFPSSDRARALEFALEHSWANLTQGNESTEKTYMNAGLREFWRPVTKYKPWPLLIFTATKATAGSRVALVPFRMRPQMNLYFEPARWERRHSESNENEDLSDTSTASLIDTEDVRLSTSIGLSSRFPLILPPANIGSRQGPRRLVDGAYFENTAIETALDLIAQLTVERNVFFGETSASKRDYQFHLLILTEVTGDEGEEWGLNEVGGHIQALFNTRLRRAHLARNNKAAKDDNLDGRLFIIELNRDKLNLPFGLWQGSLSQEIVAAQVGLKKRFDEKACRNYFVESDFRRTDWYDKDNEAQRTLAMVHRNNCTYLDLLNVVRGVAQQRGP